MPNENNRIDLRFSIPRRGRETEATPPAPDALPKDNPGPIRTPAFSRAGDASGGEEFLTAAAKVKPFVEEPRVEPATRVEVPPAKGLAGRVFLFAIFLGLLLGLPVLFLHLGEIRGEKRGQKIRAEAAGTALEALSPQLNTELDALMQQLNEGDVVKVLPHLRDLEKSHPDTPSLSYLVALAALQAGDFDLADQKVAESIRKKERVSDSLALQAVLITLRGGEPGRLSWSNPQQQAERVLRQAVAADVTNPVPLIGLARLARSSGDAEKAIGLLTAARDRLQPVDSKTVVDISIELTRLQALPDDKLPEELPASDGVSDLFGDAYMAMRRGNFSRSVELLRLSREQLPADVFNYLLLDPALRRYADEPRLAEFFVASGK